MTERIRRRLHAALDVAVLASLTVLPQLLGGRARLNADTKQYLYLDPADLMERARHLWDARVGGGTVTHQAIGYLWPMGPYYWVTDQIGLPSWAAQRLWIGGIQLVAALGALVLFRHLGAGRAARLAGAALYGLSPFVLGHVTGQSGLLLPFAALGWLVWAMAKAVERGGWRWPAVFALIVTSCASLNGSSVFFVVLAATLWVPFAVWSFGHATWRQGAAALLRTGGLTLATQLWWLLAYAVGGSFGLPILAVTEQVHTTSHTTSAAEVVRGLGYWFFYGADSEGLWLRDLAPHYMLRTGLIAASFAVPLVALALGAITRWGPRTYFAVLTGLGTVVAVGAFPEPARTPAGAAFESLSRSSELVLGLRNTQRATPLVALGLAGLAVGGITALGRRRAGVAVPASVVLVALVALAFPAQWRSGLIAERFHRPQDLPAAWVEAGQHLDRGSGRVLEVPGIDFASYRWGHTLDPVSVGLTQRPVVARELVPMGGAAGVTLLGALDRSMQEGWVEPGTLSVVARLLGASQVLVRNDLEFERYRTVRPERVWDLVTDDDAGLVLDTTFGPRERNRANPNRPLLDEIELARVPGGEPPPQVAIFDVPGGGRAAVSATAATGAVVLDGDGEGIVHAAAAGLLDDLAGPLLLGPDLTRDGGRFDELVPDGTAVVVTDTNRKRGERWYALRENVGATEPRSHPAVLDDPSDARLAVVDGQPAGAQTVVEWSGASRVWATAYGSALTLVPEERPANAFDGDPSTAWLLDTRQHRSPHRIGIELDEPVAADHVVLVQPQGRPGARAITAARITLDGRRHVDVSIGEEEARSPEGVRVELDGQPFERLTVEIRGVAPDRGPAGFAEITIPGAQVSELVTLPSAVLDALGSRASATPLALVLSRHRADPAEPVRSDPEPVLSRAFDLPAPVVLELTGTARLSPRAAGGTVDGVLGHPDPPRASESLAGDLRSRPAAAVDGDPSTAWRTPFVGLEGQWLDLPNDPGRPVTDLELAVVADGRHSHPTRLVVAAGGDAVEVELPELEPVEEANGVRTVRVPLPRALSGPRLRVTITGVDVRTTPDWYTGDPIGLPVGLAEVRASSILVAEAPTAVDTGCRDDLVTVDGAPVPVRITGSTADGLARAGLQVEACGEPRRLAAGRHEVRAAPGADTGIDIDRLVLATPGFAPAPAPSATARVTVERTGPVSASATVETDGSPFWLVFDQSHNDGWELTLEGATVDGPRPVDGYANGWFVEPDGPGTLDASIRWTPQRAVDVALALSGLAVLACLALVAVAPGTRRSPGRVPVAPALGATPTGAGGWLAVVAVAVAAALLVHPAAAPPAALVVALGRRWPWLARAVPVALVAAAALQVVAFQARDRHDAGFDWPQHFGGAHVTALAGCLLLAVLALAERRGDEP
jgi:arabinofuranan 3-O-arabinosyltransferase